MADSFLEYPIMKKLTLSALVLPLVLLAPQGAHAGPLGTAGDYSVFVFGNIEQWGTDSEGRVAAGGNAIFGRPDIVDGNGNITQANGFSIGSKITDPALNLVTGGNVTLTNGSVGYLEPGNTGSAISQKGNIVYGGTATVLAPVGYGTLQLGTPIDFAAERNFLTGLSGSLNSLASNGTTSILKDAGNAAYQINLTGTDAYRNTFSLLASDITQNLAFKFYAPQTSTIIVNIAGANASLMNLGFYFNDIAGESVDAAGQPLHPAAYPFSNILFNFSDATGLAIDNIGINGSILAPQAHVDLGQHSHVDGNLIAASLFGQGETHNVAFTGNISAIPEPDTAPLLLAGGLVVLLAKRRKATRA